MTTTKQIPSDAAGDGPHAPGTPDATDPSLEDRPLAEGSLFGEAQLAALADYGIETVGELLGATRGLTDLEGLRAIRAGLVADAIALRATLPEALLDRFALDETPMPSTGWIPGDPRR